MTAQELVKSLQIPEPVSVHDYYNLFVQNKVGRAVFEELRTSIYNKPSFSSDPLAMAHAEGQRHAIRMIIAKIEAAVNEEKQ